MKKEDYIKCLWCSFWGAIFFFILSPGVLFTIPPFHSKFTKESETSKHSYLLTAGLHSIIFGICMLVICMMCMGDWNLSKIFHIKPRYKGVAGYIGDRR